MNISFWKWGGFKNNFSSDRCVEDIHLAHRSGKCRHSVNPSQVFPKTPSSSYQLSSLPFSIFPQPRHGGTFPCAGTPRLDSQVLFN